MVRLAIDTSSPVSSVALDCGEQGIFQRELASRDTHSVTLHRALAQLIEEAPIRSLAEIEVIGIGLGPGSFTGIRIGLSFAKGLSWSWKTPLLGVPTFQAMAQQCARPNHSVAVISDARRGEFFFSAWHSRGDHLELTESLRIVSAQEIDSIISDENISAPWILVDAGNETIPFGKVEIVSAKSVAAGILAIMPTPTPWSIEQLTAIEPLYTRAVAALTISEREARGML